RRRSAPVLVGGRTAAFLAPRHRRAVRVGRRPVRRPPHRRTALRCQCRRCRRPRHHWPPGGPDDGAIAGQCPGADHATGRPGGVGRGIRAAARRAGSSIGATCTEGALNHPISAGGTPIKCLVVDDVPENLVALHALLAREGVCVLEARSGPEALELLLLHDDIALALLDVQMPEMNGFELAELIRGRERSRHIPLIFITAGTHNLDWQFKGYESGAVDFLYK